ncbi:hypothetical protein [Paracoccus aminophilus]|nr:hypothetical protein [Paracoccus aminophilus]
MRLTEHALDHIHLHRTIYGAADAPASALCKRSDEAILERLIGILDDQPDLAPGVPTDTTAALLFHALDGALHQKIMRDRQIDRDAFPAELRHFIVKFMTIEGRCGVSRS